jgi:hypothetical protein
MADTYRLLFTGSRSWADRNALYAELGEAEQRARDLGCRVILVVHGFAGGADTMADDWTFLRSLLPGMFRDRERHPLTVSEWYPGGKFDRTAGMKRNQLMVSLCADECVAAVDECRKTTCRRRKPHGSHGASHAAGLAERSGIPVRRLGMSQ